ncbi:unnamed protein product [Owenia fusiformis]|uniref:26S proteasome non-ATPase regulatory subunit 1 n=1 Tax=Owenia fusiformis TaxID=6347 RepID=A0A8J1Y0Q4_OWEFU|nr:unnamed protein product [Owenia fusiformis]
MRMNITSAAGVIALLDEPEPEVKGFALQKLDQIVISFWPEISESVEKIEMLYEDERFTQRNLAALVASKVYHHLGAFEESLTFALGAGDLFDVTDTSEYVDTTISKCIDHYTKLRVQNSEGIEDHKDIDPRLEAIVQRMFQRCFDDRQYKQAIGIALETRRIDIFEDAIKKSDDISAMLQYSLKVCMSLIQNRQFRNTVLRVMVKLYMGLPQPDFISVCQCFIFLDEPQSVADILEKLLKESEDNVLMAYQIGFDLYESATQQFLQRVQGALRGTAPLPVLLTPGSTNTGTTTKEATESAIDSGAAASSSTGEAAANAEETDAKPVSEKTLEDLSENDRKLQDRVVKLITILNGDTTIEHHLQFLIRNNKTDLLILKNTKDAVRNSVCHTATVIANGFMHAGTTCDSFLRDNLEWLARATNWAKFTATASLGTIHKGHEKEALNLMSTYLPKDTSPGSAYSEGGGLYALGLIHANHGGSITEYLLNQLKDASSDMVRHGGCLGLGLAAMGTARQDVYQQLKFNLYQDDAVTGEAAGIAMGLVMIGTKSANAIEDMVAYAQETQHEKILRGLAVGIAMTMYGRLEEADTLIESLQRDKDPILRWSAMYTIGMAYCGTANNKAIRKLLHVAVSDVNDDVRRAAVTSLGFLFFRTPEQCPQVVSLLSESYNPHVRYGAAMALGIACAGTGLKEAIGLIEPMTNDSVNYVRQGALVASAMIMVQQNEVTCSKLKHYRELYAKVISDKHEDVMAKFGSIIAQGIIDAGGRNTTISLQSRTGHTNMAAVVGTLVFCQFWYWFPLTHFLSLAFTPTSVIGLNSELKMPKVEFRSNAKPSTYAYPANLEEKKDKKGEKVSTAVLSITAKQKKKEAAAKSSASTSKDGAVASTSKDTTEKMEIDDEKKDASTEKGKDQAKTDDKDKEEEKEVKEKEKKKPEPTSEMLTNPARVMQAQLKVITNPEDARYTTLKPLNVGGIIMLRDTKPTEKEDLIEMVAAMGPKSENDDEAEPDPPEPFEWTEDM